MTTLSTHCNGLRFDDAFERRIHSTSCRPFHQIETFSCSLLSRRRPVDRQAPTSRCVYVTRRRRAVPSRRVHVCAHFRRRTSSCASSRVHVRVHRHAAVVRRRSSSAILCRRRSWHCRSSRNRRPRDSCVPRKRRPPRGPHFGEEFRDFPPPLLPQIDRPLLLQEFELRALEFPRISCFLGEDIRVFCPRFPFLRCGACLQCIRARHFFWLRVCLLRLDVFV
jgi:hypothetical protein